MASEVCFAEGCGGGMKPVEPRWLDASSAASYVSMTESAFRRRVSQGIFPKPAMAAGTQSPRWDRFALDSAFDAGASSTDATLAFQGLANEIAAKRKKGSEGSSTRPSGRQRKGIPVCRV
jgi:predicted DNA-binding transcriptional regulator AlpA